MFLSVNSLISFIPWLGLIRWFVLILCFGLIRWFQVTFEWIPIISTPNRTKLCTITWVSCVSVVGIGSLSKRTFQGDAVVKSAKARDSRRRSRAKCNLLSTCYTTRRPPFSDPSLFDPFESVMVRFKEFCQILLLLLQCQSYF